MRLIDVDALIQKVKEEEDERHLDKDTTAILQFLIDEYAEPGDAVPVIRCKDCKHYCNNKCDQFSLLLFLLGGEEDDYCSHAERKEE